MSSFVSKLAGPAIRWPGAALGLLVLITAVAAFAATHLTMETDLTEFGSEDSEVVQARDRVEDEFDRTGAAIQVVVDAGPDGDVIDAEGLATLVDIEQAVVEALDDALRRDAEGTPRIRSIAAPLDQVLGPPGDGRDETSDEEVAAAASAVLAQRPELVALVSSDADAEGGSARATSVVAELEPELGSGDRVAAAEAVAEGIGLADGEQRGEVDGLDVGVSSPELTNDRIEDETRSEAPLLLAAAVAAVAVILWVLSRSAFDVVVGLLGLGMALTWTFGAIAVAGPELLGWLGPLSQIAVVVPVLVVGLGIDFAVHLTARYREQRQQGQSADIAAATTVRTVGGALVLATLATAAGFAMTGLAPLAVVADFGVFTAIGVVAAFLVMVLLVPAASVLRDRGRGRRPAPARATGRPGPMRAATLLATGRPLVPLLLAAALVGASLWAATDLETRFDRDDFVPEDSAVGEALAWQDGLFAGALTEVTHVLVDGDLTDPAVADALAEAHERLDGVEHVRADLDGHPQVTSVLTLAGGTWEPLPTDTDRAQEHLRREVGEEGLARLVRDDLGASVVELATNAGDGDAEALAAAIEEAFGPVVDAGGAVTVTSDAMVIAEMADELRDFQLRSIGLTLASVAALLVGYYGLARRRPALGAIAMVPAVTGAALLLGAMGALGVDFDALTATLTAIAVGIGVPYGVHVANRFAEELDGGGDAAEACARSLRTTGGALAGSALTTLGAFVVLSLSGLELIAQMGLLGAAGITFALLGGVLVQPSALVLWARHRPRAAPAGAGFRAAPLGGGPVVPSPQERGGRGPALLDVAVPPPPRREACAAAAGRDGEGTPSDAGKAAAGEDAWRLVVDDGRLGACQVNVARREGASIVEAVELRPPPGASLTPAAVERWSVGAIVSLARAYAEARDGAASDGQAGRR